MVRILLLAVAATLLLASPAAAAPTWLAPQSFETGLPADPAGADIAVTPNGTAIAVRRQAFSNLTFRDIPLSGDGNHAELVAGVHKATGRRFRAASIHLDSDVEANRSREARALMAELPPVAGTTDVVCGDFNEDAVTGTAGGIVRRAGFVDVLDGVGNREPTHPWSSSYSGATRWAIIDPDRPRGPPDSSPSGVRRR